jgi:LacI family transcriptional regulator
MRAVRERRLNIPNDFALAYFDKIEPVDLITPTLTMVVQPAYNFGTIATQLLLERLEGLPVKARRATSC